MSEVVIIAVCLLLNALLAAYEMAFVSVSRAELREAARNGNQLAKRILRLRENPERTLSVIQVGITLVGAVAAAVGGAGAAESLEPYFIKTFGLSMFYAEFLAVLLVVVPITYFTVVVGELVPKTIALRNPINVVLKGASSLFLADRLLAPVVSTLEWSTKRVLSLCFKRSIKSENVAGASLDMEALSPGHQRLILNMAEIENKVIREIFLPWSQVNHVKLTDSIAEVTQVVLSSGHTRLPVTENGGIAGILHTKEFVAMKETGETHWQSLIRSIIKVQATDSALAVLRLLQTKRCHMAIVFSSTDVCLGIVTLEDIIEEVVGDIFDEDDDGKVRQVFASKAKSRQIQRMKDFTDS